MLKQKISYWNSRKSSANNTYTSIQKNEALKQKTAFPDSPSVPKLLQIKKVALRRGIWYRTLSRLERGVIDLTVKFVDNIKSAKLAKVVSAIVDKLKLATESVLAKTIKSYGHSQTQKISSIAQRWGNPFAYLWAEDVDFARYLSVLYMNGAGIFKT